jgi:hypothetical protein
MASRSRQRPAGLAKEAMMSPFRRVIPASLALVILLAVPASRSAAQISNDPYSPWNAMYRPFVFPNTYYNPAIPNQARLNRMAEEATEPRFGRYFDAMSGFDQDLFGRSQQLGGRGVPYHQAYRAQRAAASLGSLDESMTMINRGDTFRLDQEARQRRFFEAMRERNPRKRAEMLRELESERLQATRSASAPIGSSLPTVGRPRTVSAPSESPPEPSDPSAASPAARGAIDPFTLLRPLTPATGAAPAGSLRGFDDEAPRISIPRPRPVIPAELDNLLNRQPSDVPDPIIPRH